MDEKKVDLTEVVEKVAQFQYERFSKTDDGNPEWKDTPPIYKYQFKEIVTPLVVATLDAAGVKY